MYYANAPDAALLTTVEPKVDFGNVRLGYQRDEPNLNDIKLDEPGRRRLPRARTPP